MGGLVERYRRELRPCRKVTDMILLAAIITVALLFASTQVSNWIIPLVGLPRSLTSTEVALIGSGGATAQELTGAPAYLVFASMYLGTIGVWIVFPLAMLIPPANRRMLQKMIFVRDRRSLAMACIGVLLGFAINSACVGASVLLGNLRLHFEHFEIGPFLLLLFAVFVQSGSEEIVMRHYLYQKLARRYRHPAVAVVGSSVFFTLLHGLNPGMTWLAVVQLMTMSLLCCVLVHYYDALGACVAMHTAWNFTQSIVYGLPNSGGGSLYSVFGLDAASNGPFFDTVFGVEGSIGSVVLMLLACAGLFVYAKRRGLRAPDLWEDEEGKADAPDLAA